MKTKNITQTLIMAILILFSLNLSFAADEISGSVNLELLNQDPDPVKAGEIVTVRISVNNIGDTSIEDYTIRFQDQYPFTLFESEQREYYIPNILSRASGTSAQIIKFKVNVDEEISEGNYPIKIIGISKNGARIEKEFNIEVNSEANAEISSISVNSLVPGKKTKIDFGIKNVGKSDLENVKFSWESQDDIILPVGSGNFKYLDKIETGKEEIVSFEVVSDLNTEPKLYKLDLKLEYDDVESLQTITDAGTIKNEKRREIISKAGIYVGGKTDFEISQKDSDINSITFSIANIGSTLASSVVVKVPEQNNFQATSSESKVVGNIKKGSFGRVEFDLEKIGKENEINLIIEYTDTTGQRQSDQKTIKANLQNKNLFDNQNQTQNSSNTKNYFFATIIIVLGVIWYFRKSKTKKHN